MQLWLTCVVVFVLLIWAASAIGQAKGGAMIAFTSTRTGQPEIYLMDVELGIAHRPNSINTPGRSPTWSPDNLLAFVRNDQLHINDGHTTTIVETPPSPSRPEWSPDGTRIVFLARGRNSFQNLYIWNRYTGEIDRLTDESLNVGIFEWSPDSNRLGFVNNRNSPFEIHILDVGTGDVYTIPDVRSVVGQLAWSPDGTRLAFIVFEDERTGIVIWDSRNNSIRSLIPPDDYDYISNPAWSPNGEWIAFVSWDANGWNVIMTNLFRGEIYNLTQNRSIINHIDALSWSPDGTYLAFMVNVGGGSDLYIIDIATGEVRNLTNGGRPIYYEIAWRP